MIKQLTKAVAPVVIVSSVFAVAGNAQAGSSQSGSAKGVTQAKAADNVDAKEVAKLAADLRAGKTVSVAGDKGTTWYAQKVGDSVQIWNNSMAKAPQVSGTSTPITTESLNYGWCTWSVTAAIYGLGAAGVATLVAAAVMSGSEFVMIAGARVTVDALKAIATMLGSWSAVYAYVASHVC